MPRSNALVQLALAVCEAKAFGSRLNDSQRRDWTQYDMSLTHSHDYV